ncbi:Translation machinery-associated protein 16 [Spironucleus salmonicida]|uniref:Translation machinery-associated protein 16 n=1 Tax=Spironucleus salmonicida TaxID=348837 RepID=V6LVL5_9EUKA|nr:Translation machinery-associated protein 16 [Spironucleus salmonicida]|eukprot:EST48657.1 hypothetical protein SS50377_11270 [Spironucleus salmonicida]
MPPKHFVHPRSREAEYTFARKNRDIRVRDQSLAHRSNKRQPIIGLYKFLQDKCLLNKDKHEYHEQDIVKMTTEYILSSYTNLQQLKSNIANQSKQLAFSSAVQMFNQGQFDVPDITDKYVTVKLLLWDGQSSSASGLKTIKIKGNIKIE